MTCRYARSSVYLRRWILLCLPKRRWSHALPLRVVEREQADKRSALPLGGGVFVTPFQNACECAHCV